MNNVGIERGLIAPRQGCAIYLQLSRSDAISFVTLAQMRVYVGVLGLSVSRQAPRHTHTRTGIKCIRLSYF